MLHRLLLAVECVDAVLRRRPDAGVRIGRELARAGCWRAATTRTGRAWTCRAGGPGRAVLCFDHRSPVHTDLVLRIVDPARRFVARRLRVPPWQLAEILAAEQNPADGAGRFPAAAALAGTRYRATAPRVGSPASAAGWPEPAGRCAGPG